MFPKVSCQLNLLDVKYLLKVPPELLFFFSKCWLFLFENYIAHCILLNNAYRDRDCEKQRLLWIETLLIILWFLFRFD